MESRFGHMVIGLALSIAPMFAQWTQTRRATVTIPAGDAGKCTIEVEVDGSAQVELFGVTGRLRTLSGAPAAWRWFECNGSIPSNPANFRFWGLDGREHQELVADPRRNGGIAVIRISDANIGRRDYAFDVKWTRAYVGNDLMYRGGASRNDRADFPPQTSYGGDYDSSVDVCQDVVRDRASRDHGYRNIQFYNLNYGYKRAQNDYVSGTFDGHRGDGSEQMRYACIVNSGRTVTSVKIQPVENGRVASSVDGR
jgi:hypothetical protein